MKELLENRLGELKAQFEIGQQALGELEERQAGVRTTHTRISGAIQVLEELLQQAGAAPAGGAPGQGADQP